MKPKLGDMTVFTATVNLDPLKSHQFKYVVDEIWRCSLDFPTVADDQGNVNNLLAAGAWSFHPAANSTNYYPAAETVAVLSGRVSPPVALLSASSSSESHPDVSHFLVRSDAGKVTGVVGMTDEQPPRLKGSLKHQYSQKQRQQESGIVASNAYQPRA